MDVITIIFGIISVLGVGFTIFYGLKAEKLKKGKKTLTWNELQVIVDSICFKMKKDKFTPDIILAPGLRGGIISELIINKFDRNIPVFVGISYRDFEENRATLKVSNYDYFFINNDWDILVPNSIFDFKDKKILFVDDFCLTGEFFVAVRKYLIDNGFTPQNIKFFCSVITRVTISSNRAPEYYSVVTDDDYYYFPWGKANMG